MSENPTVYRPKRCVFEATLACNLHCRHCGSSAGRARTDELTTGEAADLFKELFDLGCKRVTISGGEPMLRPDWPDLIRAVSRTGMKAAMITNGIAFDDEAARLARQQGLVHLGFSVDGLDRTHDRIRGRIGHFRMLTRAMASARQSHIPFTIITHLNRLNLGEIEMLHDVAKHEGAFSWQVQPALDMGNMHQHPGLLLRSRDLPRIEERIGRLIRRNEIRIATANSLGYFGPNEKRLRDHLRLPCFRGCGAGMRTLGIESNGNVKGCLALQARHQRCGADVVEGNVHKERLATIWLRPGAFAYNREWRIDDLGGFCRECRHASLCRGGCRAVMVTSGNGAENPMCVYRQLLEERRRNRRAGQAAAVVLAALLGASSQGCYRSDRIGPGDAQADADSHDYGDTGTDADSDADGDSDTDVDTDADADGDSDTDSYDIDYDVDADSDFDASEDSGPDAALDADIDATDDASPDAARDASGDAFQDASKDTGPDAD